MKKFGLILGALLIASAALADFDRGHDGDQGRDESRFGHGHDGGGWGHDHGPYPHPHPYPHPYPHPHPYPPPPPPSPYPPQPYPPPPPPGYYGYNVTITPDYNCLNAIRPTDGKSLSEAAYWCDMHNPQRMNLRGQCSLTSQIVDYNWANAIIARSTTVIYEDQQQLVRNAASTLYFACR